MQFHCFRSLSTSSPSPESMLSGLSRPHQRFGTAVMEDGDPESLSMASSLHTTAYHAFFSASTQENSRLKLHRPQKPSCLACFVYQRSLRSKSRVFKSSSHLDLQTKRDEDRGRFPVRQILAGLRTDRKSGCTNPRRPRPRRLQRRLALEMPCKQPSLSGPQGPTCSVMH